MKNIVPDKYHIEFDMENVNVSVTMAKGFFDLSGEPVVHNHHNYEVHFVMDGSAYLETEEEKYLFECFEGCILPRELIHNGIFSNEPGIKTSFNFDYRHNKRKSSINLFEIFEESFGVVNRVVKFGNGEKYVALLRNIMSVFYSGVSCSEPVLKCLFGALIMQLAESAELSPAKINSSTNGIKSFTDVTLMRAVMEEYITGNSRPVLKELANAVHLSVRHTERIFESEFGMKFKDYVANYRIKKAKYYLTKTELSITEIAEILGFESYHGFYRLFGARIGISPTEYRNTNNISR